MGNWTVTWFHQPPCSAESNTMGDLEPNRKTLPNHLQQRGLATKPGRDKEFFKKQKRKNNRSSSLRTSHDASIPTSRWWQSQVLKR